MIIEPKVRGFICTTAHPAGCYESVKSQIDYVKLQPWIQSAPKNVLIIGASTGYGLASRIVSTYAAGAKTIGVFFEKPASEKRTATAGWYNTSAFEKMAHEDGYYAKSINGDAFSDEIKEETIQLIRKDLRSVDLVIYSLASPRRTDPKTGKIYSSTLKPIGKAYCNKTVDPLTGIVSEISIAPANQEEIDNTIAVMGGEDWAMWIDALQKANALSDKAITFAYSYIGPSLTHPIYKNGTIGKAKNHLLQTAQVLNEKLKNTGGCAFVSVNKALVTQSSSAIPVVPLYISILFKIMKKAGTHENCVEQIYRLMNTFFCDNKAASVDSERQIRIDDLEMKSDVQNQIEKIWTEISTQNINALADLEGYKRDFYKLFGFEIEGVDYQKEIDIDVKIPSIGN